MAIQLAIVLSLLSLAACGAPLASAQWRKLVRREAKHGIIGPHSLMDVTSQTGTYKAQLLNIDSSGATMQADAEDSPVLVAVVGSGPISEADRKLIQSAKEIYRFNSMLNLRSGEHVGVVFSRRKGIAAFPDHLSGFPPNGDACALVKNADGLIIVLEGAAPFPEQKLKELRQDFKLVGFTPGTPSSPLTVDGKTFVPNSPVTNQAYTVWTTGFIGVNYVLHQSALVAQGAKVHIFGMNWNGAPADLHHPWALEKKILNEAPSVMVHPTPYPSYTPQNFFEGKEMMTCEGAYS